MAPSVKLHVTSSRELKASVMMWARRRSEARISAFSATNWSYEASPGCGGFIIKDMLTWPTTLGDRFTEAILYSSSTAPWAMFFISTYPPRRPHSPTVPFDTVWKESSSTSLRYGSPISEIVLRMDTKGRSSW
eukprot:scaffold588_cov389-Prasinococcus_capsulatus_cf.AAC.3